MNKKTFLLLALIACVVAAGIIVSHKNKTMPSAEQPPTATLSVDLYPLYPSVIWGPVAAATIADIIDGSETTWTSQDISMDTSATSTAFEAYYKNKLENLGWTEDLDHDAGGAGTEDVAYKKGNQRIIVDYSNIFVDEKPDQPVACPCKLSLTLFNGTWADFPIPYENATYSVEGVPVTLKDGASVTPNAPGSASVITTKIIENINSVGDLNGDGDQNDNAVFLTQDAGGSGTFYYVAACINNSNDEDTSTGTNAILLGDRIQPVSLIIKDGIITVNYLDRNPTDPMSAPPTVSVTKHFKVEDGKLVSAD